MVSMVMVEYACGRWPCLVDASFSQRAGLDITLCFHFSVCFSVLRESRLALFTNMSVTSQSFNWLLFLKVKTPGLEMSLLAAFGQ